MAQTSRKRRRKDKKHQPTSKRLNRLSDIDVLNMQTEYEQSESLRENSEFNQSLKIDRENFHVKK